MTYTVESKNQLAKLLATENLTIEHKVVSTASFDIKNRVLTCPIWKDMTSDLYDLMMGHEVGHALNTPLDGWHDSVSTKGKNYKHFLNVVEDARIEKKMKRKYPGLKRQFVSAYKKLLEDNFFGVSRYFINELSLIDKINIHFKCGVDAKVKFTDAEMVYVQRIELCETWDDVVGITDDLFAYCKGEQQGKHQDNHQDDFELSPDESGDYPDSEDYDVESSDGESEDEPEDEDIEEMNSNSSGDESEDEDSEDEDSEDEDEEGDDAINREKDSKESDEDQFEPECITDENFRRNEKKLIDEKCLPYVYLTIPTPVPENIITPQKRVHEILDGEFLKQRKMIELKNFKRKNENYTSLLVKEFEMRKAATTFAKRKISASGDIDVNKIYKYQLEDTIFRKITKVPKGKSHGLVLLLDRSGSMSNNFDGAIEQIMVLAMFCRRVNIPFVVYGFGNDIRGRSVDFPNEISSSRVSFAKSGVNNLRLGNVALREYLNSKMNIAEFTNALANLAYLKTQYKKYGANIPLSERLSNTPLVEAMVALKPIVEEFRQSSKLDIVNLAIVHDGDADNVNVYSNEHENKRVMDVSAANYFLVDKKTKFQTKLVFNNQGYVGEAQRHAIFEWFTSVTKTKIFGFFIVTDSKGSINGAIAEKYYIKGEKFSKIHSKNNDPWAVRWLAVTNEMGAKFRKDKLLVSSNPGYEKFFMILGGKGLVTDFDDMGVEEGASVRKLKTAFSKMNEKKKTNRVLVNQFIEGIAA
jgi:hypothetical protein